MTSVDLTEIVSQIVRDAAFESRERNGSVKLTAREQFFVQGDAKLLQSAIENLVRNAIRHTEPGTPGHSGSRRNDSRRERHAAGPAGRGPPAALLDEFARSRIKGA